MNKLFTIALLAAIALADDAEDDLDLMNYASKFGKSYANVAEMQERKQNLKESRKSRDELEKEHPNAKFGDNKFSDFSKKEM